MTNDTPNPRYTIRTAAKRVHMSPATLGPMIEAGMVPGATKRGTRYYIFAAAFDRWIAGDWTPRPQPQPVQMIQRRKKESI